MEFVSRLGATHLAVTMATYGQALRLHQEALNALNVYPVPDGDTGTNMALTLESVVAALAGLEGLEQLVSTPPAGQPAGSLGRGVDGGGVQGHRPRVAHGGTGELGGHPVPVAARPHRRAGRERRGRGRARPRPGPGGRQRRGAPGGAATGRGHDPHRGPSRGGGCPTGRTRRCRSGRGGRGVAPRRGRRPGAHARAAPRPRPGRRRRRRRVGLPAASRRGADRHRRPAAPTGPGRHRPGVLGRRRRPPRRRVRSPRSPAPATTCATRSCTSSRPPTTPWGPSRRCGRASATPSSWSAATVCGTATSTPTTWALRSRRPSTPAGPATSGSPTSPSRSRRSAGSGRARGCREPSSPRRAPRRAPPWWRWPTARASAGSSDLWACTTSWRAVSR